ncbi:hypothetical protein [Ruminococcus flavefaciens]|uniref:hypothetical protein n=1 Tax=Ruminococcus flavefaciens TaxID=1265 RepID=UPI00046640D5|nr:hypothetical protein [Ruminococcus flavefaciens]
MKKIAVAVILCLCTALFFGCGNSQQSSGSSSESTKNSSSDEFDIDLTKMSSTMVYSTVYSMMMAPDDYVGKTVKVTGNFNEYKDESTGKTYYSVLISDATACCQQGMEFDMGSGYSDYPPENALITVTGTFETYMEGKAKYCQLAKATLKRE